MRVPKKSTGTYKNAHFFISILPAHPIIPPVPQSPVRLALPPVPLVSPVSPVPQSPVRLALPPVSPVSQSPVRLTCPTCPTCPTRPTCPTCPTIASAARTPTCLTCLTCPTIASAARTPNPPSLLSSFRKFSFLYLPFTLDIGRIQDHRRITER